MHNSRSSVEDSLTGDLLRDNAPDHASAIVMGQHAGSVARAE